MTPQHSFSISKYVNAISLRQVYVDFTLRNEFNEYEMLERIRNYRRP